MTPNGPCFGVIHGVLCEVLCLQEISTPVFSIVTLSPKTPQVQQLWTKLLPSGKDLRQLDPTIQAPF